MEKANQFFFLSGVSDNVVCDFSRPGNGTVALTFCNVADKSHYPDRLVMAIRTESIIESATGKEVKDHFISYQLESGRWGSIEQADSVAIRDSEMVWGIVTAVVNDVFPCDSENQIS